MLTGRGGCIHLHTNLIQNIRIQLSLCQHPPLPGISGGQCGLVMERENGLKSCLLIYMMNVAKHFPPRSDLGRVHLLVERRIE